MINNVLDYFYKDFLPTNPYLIGGIVIMIIGGLLLFGAIINHRWIQDGGHKRGIASFVHAVFGEMGTRILTGIIGSVFILVGLFLIIESFSAK